ncbi:hypothetical protein IT412_05430 [Candidatus Peregrinibacteria bacterium]|nr:hypothetical protein [Candidatus Peregrinibacteria bacterium]
MAKGKSTFATWYCTETGKPKKTTAYDKRRNDEIVKELKMYNKDLRKRTVHKRKDVKKAS